MTAPVVSAAVELKLTTASSPMVLSEAVLTQGPVIPEKPPESRVRSHSETSGKSKPTPLKVTWPTIPGALALRRCCR